MHAADAALDAQAGVLPDDQGASKRFGHRGEGAVVRCRPQTSAHEHVGDLRIRKFALELIDYLTLPVADCGDAFDGIAEQTKPLSQPVRVGIEGEPADHFVSVLADVSGHSGY